MYVRTSEDADAKLRRNAHGAIGVLSMQILTCGSEAGDRQRR